MSRTPTKNIDYTSRDYEAFRALLIAKLQEKMPEYTDTSETDAGIVIIEALANGLDVMSLYADVVANDVLLPTTQSRRLAVLIANCLGYYPYNSTASEYEQVFYLSKPRTVTTIIPKGTVVKTPNDADLATLYYVTTTDHAIPAGYVGDERDEKTGKYLFTTPIVAGQVIKQDVIGTSTGAPMQSFKTNYLNVLIDSLEVRVNEGAGENVWKRVDTFFDADENSMVYLVLIDEYDQCTIQFGNGIKGKIPTVFPNGITATYRVGGGEVSNVAQNSITVLDTGIAHVAGTFNLDITVRGHDKEPLESIKINAPAAFRTRDRLVTCEDYSDLLRLNFFDFLWLKAIKDTDPPINGKDRRFCHIFYMMKPGYTFNEGLAERVDEFIKGREMIGCIYDIREYTPQVVNIDAMLYYDKDYDGEVLETYIRDYLAGVTFAYGNLVFGDELVKHDIERELKLTFDGIISFRINTPTDDIITPTTPWNVLTLGTISITKEAL